MNIKEELKIIKKKRKCKWCCSYAHQQIEMLAAPGMEDEYSNFHKVQFLEVMANRGCFTMATHNEHNWYYGGFVVRIEAE